MARRGLLNDAERTRLFEAPGDDASLIETCKLAGVEPQAYLTDVLTRIVNDHPNSRIDELLPWAYAEQTEPTAVA